MAFETISLFDDLENDQTMQRVASRRALALADTRVEKHLGAFFRGAQNLEEFEARLALVVDDFDHYVTSAAEEIGYTTPEHIRETILASYREASGEPCPNCGKPGGCDHGPGEHKEAAEQPVQFGAVPEESEEDEDAPPPKTSALKWSLDNFTAPGNPSGSASMPPNGNMTGAPAVTPPVQNAATTVNPQAGGAAAVPTVPQGTTNPNADINDIGAQAQGGVPLAANATMPGMQAQTPTVTGGVHVAEEHYSPADQELDGDGASVLDALDHSGPDEGKSKKSAGVWTVTAMGDPWVNDYDYGRDKGVSDQMLQQPPQMDPRAQFQHGAPAAPHQPQPGSPEWDQLYAQQSVAPPGFQQHAAEQNNTDLGGPEPKIDKSHGFADKPKPEDSGRWPTKEKDIVKPIKAENRDVDGKANPGHQLTEIGEQTTKTENLPANKGDAGFDDGGVTKGPHTKTFDGKGQVDPVTKPVFPDKSAVEAAFRALV